MHCTNNKHAAPHFQWVVLLGTHPLHRLLQCVGCYWGWYALLLFCERKGGGGAGQGGAFSLQPLPVHNLRHIQRECLELFLHGNLGC